MARAKQTPSLLRIETALARAYATYPALVSARAVLVAAGIASDAVPNDDTLRAFSVLSDYQRPQVVARLEPYYPSLEAKGLLRANPADTTTPELRLLAAIVDQIEPLQTVGERFAAGLALAQTPAAAINGPQIRCARTISGPWGQPTRVYFAVSDAEWILVRPEPVFGVAETMLRCGQSDFNGRFVLPVDNGRVLLAAMAAGGEVSAHHLDFSVVLEAT